MSRTASARSQLEVSTPSLNTISSAAAGVRFADHHTGVGAVDQRGHARSRALIERGADGRDVGRQLRAELHDVAERDERGLIVFVQRRQQRRRRRRAAASSRSPATLSLMSSARITLSGI